ncbi:nucleotidyltransferase domain-containing protein [Candidatus Bathyarchaeota archaeon]|nr:nucleotidyltransferase domain-containing protein [Candidatus Bathyarchaeota archaeon]
MSFPRFSREEIVKEIGRCVEENRERLGLCKVLLFGSYARGDYTVASDIDIFVVFDDEKSSENEVYKTLMKGIKLPRVELHIMSRRRFEECKDSKWIKTMEEEGVKILDAL